MSLWVSLNKTCTLKQYIPRQRHGLFPWASLSLSLSLSLTLSLSLSVCRQQVGVISRSSPCHAERLRQPSSSSLISYSRWAAQAPGPSRWPRWLPSSSSSCFINRSPQPRPPPSPRTLRPSMWWALSVSTATCYQIGSAEVKRSGPG